MWICEEREMDIYQVARLCEIVVGTESLKERGRAKEREKNVDGERERRATCWSICERHHVR